MWSVRIVSGLLAVGTLLTIAEIGKPRKPTTHATAVMVVMVNALLMWALLAGW